MNKRTKLQKDKGRLGKYMAEHVDVLLTEEEVDAKIREIAEQINKDYEGKELHIICILKGSIFFTCELAKRISVPVTLDFMQVSSYGSDTKSSGVIKIAKDLDESILERDILVIEDIVDSGNTIVELKRILEEKGAAESRICTLLFKPYAYKKDIKLDYIAMEIPNDFIVGFGLDYDELGRNYKDIYVLDE